MSVRTLFGRLWPLTARQIQADLTAVVVWTLCTVVVLLSPVSTVVRFLFGVSFLLFVPGYAVVAALFPEAHRPTPQPTTDGIDAETSGLLPGRLSRGTGIDGVERAALAFGTSIAVVPLTGLTLSVSPWGVGLLPIVGAVAGGTLCAVGVAAYRRWQLPEERRFSVPYRAWIAAGRGRVFDADSRLDALLTVGLVLSLLLAFGSLGYAVASPPDGEQYSEFYLLSEGPSGDLVADRYPSELVAGEPEPIVVGIENFEEAPTEYTVVVEIQDVEPLEDNRVRVRNRERVDTLETTLEHGETWRTEHDLVSTMTGEPPAEPSTETADQSLHLWVDVAEPATGSGA